MLAVGAIAFAQSANFVLVVVPLFVMMGEALAVTTIGRDLFTARTCSLRVWQSSLGVSDQLPDSVSRTGRPNVGGSIATAGGLVFIGATDDSRFRAFDAQTGDELWTVKLAASAHATPITYQGKDEKQYVAVVATGGSFLESPITGDEVDVFALP